MSEDKQFEADNEPFNIQVAVDHLLDTTDDRTISQTPSELFILLSQHPTTANYLRSALVEGRIDGSTYYGECSCIKGTIRNALGAAFMEDVGLYKYPFSPIEVWFSNIHRHDTDEDNPYSFLAVKWIDEFLSLHLPKEEESMMPIECPHCAYQGFIPETLYESGEDITCKKCDRYIVLDGQTVDYSDTAREE